MHSSNNCTILNFILICHLDTSRSVSAGYGVKFKQVVRNVAELFTFCHRFEQYLCSVCEFGVFQWDCTVLFFEICFK